MNKQEAAAFLGVSERTVAAYAANGRLNVRYVKGKTRDVADYDEAELERLKQFLNAEAVNRERANNEARTVNNDRAIVKQPAFPFQKSNPETAQNPEALSFTVISDERMKELFEAPRMPEKTLFTFAEAARFSGVSEKLLRDAARGGVLRSCKIGRAARLRRVDLDSWIDAQFT